MNVIHFDTTDTEVMNKEFLGGKGCSLVDMHHAGIPVPPGFIIPCYASVSYATKVDDEADAYLEAWTKLAMEGWTGSNYGKALDLVSVRSGAPVSMPGMMDTILNVGLTHKKMPSWEKRLGKRTAWDCYRRLIYMLGTTAFGIPEQGFKDIADPEGMSAAQLESLCEKYLSHFYAVTAKSFPDTPEDQLRAAIRAVMHSWNSPRAKVYRKLHNIPESMGTAVVVQQMVFGNMNEKSATGVLFTRNPSTGEDEMFGEFLINAQGEDVVAGTHTPMDVWDMNCVEYQDTIWPEIYDELKNLCHKLEEFYKDMVDIEFTVEDGQLYVLQSRVGKRSAIAAFRIAHDFMDHPHYLGPADALKMISAQQYKMATRPFVDGSKHPPTMTGIAASPGAARGALVFTSEDAVKLSKQGMDVILMTKETTPDDIEGMSVAKAIVTLQGGATSHAAVVARAMDLPCVCGVGGDWSFDPFTAQVVGNGVVLDAGALVTVCGVTGKVWLGVDVPMVDGSQSEHVVKMQKLALERHLAMPITTCADRPECKMYFADLVELCEDGDFSKFFPDTEDCLRVILNLYRSHELAADKISMDVDTDLSHMFGSYTYENHQLMLLVTYLIDNAGTLAKKVTLEGDPLPQDWKEALSSAGYSFCHSAETLADLFGEQPVNLTTAFVNRVFGDEATLMRTLPYLGMSGKLNMQKPAMHTRTAMFISLQP